MQNGEAEIGSEEDVAGDLDGAPDEETYTAEELEEMEAYPDEDAQGGPEDESAVPEDVGAEGDDDDNEQAQAVSDYLVRFLFLWPCSGQHCSQGPQEGSGHLLLQPCRKQLAIAGDIYAADCCGSKLTMLHVLLHEVHCNSSKGEFTSASQTLLGLDLYR